MRTKTFAITDEVRGVLAEATIDATTVKLSGQLERDLYVQVDKVLKGAGGKWNRKAGVHVFDRDPREALGLAIETGKATNIQQTLQAFYTPAVVADRVVELARIADDHLVLEPSAGEGALVDAIMRTHVIPMGIQCYEIDRIAADRLAKKGYGVENQDFLRVPAEVNQRFDRIIMNPPFTRGDDELHVRHALKFLKLSGRLVTIMADRPRSDGFNRFAGEPEVAEKLPAGTFKESGTNVRSEILVFNND